MHALTGALCRGADWINVRVINGAGLQDVTSAAFFFGIDVSVPVCDEFRIKDGSRVRDVDFVSKTEKMSGRWTYVALPRLKCARGAGVHLSSCEQVCLRRP